MGKTQNWALRGVGAAMIAFVTIVGATAVPDIAAKLGKARDAEQRRTEIAVATHKSRNHSEVLWFTDGITRHVVVLSDEPNMQALRQKGDELIVHYDPHDPEGNIWFDGKPGEPLFSPSTPIFIAIFLGMGICCLVLAGKDSGTPPVRVKGESRPRRPSSGSTSQATDDILYL